MLLLLLLRLMLLLLLLLLLSKPVLLLLHNPATIEQHSFAVVMCILYIYTQVFVSIPGWISRPLFHSELLC